MEQLTDIKKRIKSVTETRKITKAMSLISAVKMRDSKELEEKTHPFMEQVALTIAELVNRSPELVDRILQFKDFEPEERYPVQIYLLTGDKGLSGSFNEDIMNLCEKLIAHKTVELAEKGHHNVGFELKFCGRMGREHMKRRGYQVNDHFNFSIDSPNYYHSMDLADEVVAAAENGEAAEVYFVYCRLDSAISTEALYTRVLPIDAAGMLYAVTTHSEKRQKERAAFSQNFAQATGLRGRRSEQEAVPRDQASDPDARITLPFAFEGDEKVVLNYLVGTYINALVFGMLTEAYASEQLSRMTSMEAATTNADELLFKLTQERNKHRQRQITTELTEIVSGAEAIQREEN